VAIDKRSERIGDGGDVGGDGGGDGGEDDDHEEEDNDYDYDYDVVPVFLLPEPTKDKAKGRSGG
jgi:hypothetical protein